MRKRRNFRKKPKDTAQGLSVTVFNNNVDGALRILKKKVKEELDSKDVSQVKKLIRQVVADILRDLWIKRSIWKDKR